MLGASTYPLDFLFLLLSVYSKYCGLHGVSLSFHVQYNRRSTQMQTDDRSTIHRELVCEMCISISNPYPTPDRNQFHPPEDAQSMADQQRLAKNDYTPSP